MKRTTAMRLWALSLMICGLCSLLLNLNHLIPLHLPDALLTAAAVLCMLAVPVLLFTSLCLWKAQKKQVGNGHERPPAN